MKILNNMINQKQLCEFLVKAKKAGYASGNNTNKTKEKNKSKTITCKNGDWLYYDNYFVGKKKIYEAKYIGGLINQRKEKNG